MEGCSRGCEDRESRTESGIHFAIESRSSRFRVSQSRQRHCWRCCSISTLRGEHWPWTRQAAAVGIADRRSLVRALAWSLYVARYLKPVVEAFHFVGTVSPQSVSCNWPWAKVHFSRNPTRGRLEISCNRLKNSELNKDVSLDAKSEPAGEVGCSIGAAVFSGVQSPCVSLLLPFIVLLSMSLFSHFSPSFFPFLFLFFSLLNFTM